MAVFRVGQDERRKAVPGYGGRYEVSDLGRVFSGGMEMSLIRGRYVNLCWRGEVRRVDVSYLVARAFVPNVEGRLYVEHLDGDLENCRADNLVWVEKCGTLVKRGRGRRVLGVVQYTLEGDEVARFGSVKEASEMTGVSCSVIRGCAEGRTERGRRWIFRYVL
jgi:hypothetical protein